MKQHPHRYKINTTSFKHYWEQGAGKELLTQHQLNLSVSNSEQFIPYLFEVDEDADAIITLFFDSHSIAEGFARIEQCISASDLSHESPQVQAFFQPKIPAWANLESIQNGVNLCQRGELSSFIVLRNYALMGGYESAAINKPLIATGALKRGAIQRLGDTVDFWVNITGDGAFENDKKGIKAIVKTRLIHAFSRKQILTKTDWDSQKWGLPINTWDVLATNLGFSLVFLVGLRKLKIAPTTAEAKGIFELWKLVGYLIGIPEKLLPETEKEAVEALFYWTMTQTEADEDSIALAHALKDESLQLKSPKLKIARTIMQQTHLAFNLELLGTYSFHCLQLPLPKLTIFKKIVLIFNSRWNKKSMKNEVNYHKMRKKGRKTQVDTAKAYNDKNR